MGRRKHIYFLYRVEDNELIFSAPYFEDIEEYIDDELDVSRTSDLDDYYIVNDKNKLISLKYVENQGYD